MADKCSRFIPGYNTSQFYTYFTIHLIKNMRALAVPMANNHEYVQVLKMLIHQLGLGINPTLWAPTHVHIYLWHCHFLETFLLVVIYTKYSYASFTKSRVEGMFSICSDQMSVKASAFSLDSGATDWAASESSKHPVTHASAEPRRASWTIWGLCRLKCFRGEISWSYKHAVHIIKLS